MLFHWSFKPDFRRKQLNKKRKRKLKPENSQKQTNKQKQNKTEKKKKPSEFWKLDVVYFCTVKTFFSQFSKLGADDGGEDNQALEKVRNLQCL